MNQVSKAKLISVAAGTFLMMLCQGIILNSTTYFIKPVSEFLGCSATQFSLYFTIVTVCSAIMSMVVMNMVNRLGIRVSILVACIGVACGYFLLSMTQSLWMVYAAAALIGTFQAFAVVPTISVINAWFTDRAGTVTGISMSATGFGGLLMGMIMPNIVASLDWRTAYRVTMIIWIVITILASFLAGGKAPVRATAGKKSKDKEEKGTSDAAPEAGKAIYRNPVFYLLMLSALMTSGITMITQHMSVLLETNGLSIAMISFIISIMSLGLAVGKIVEGMLSDRLPLRGFVVALYLVGTVGWFCLSTHTPALLILGVMSYGINGPVCTVFYPKILRTLFGAKTGASVWGICWAMFMAGQSIWVPLYAAIYDRTGGYTAGLYLGASIFLIIAVFMFLILGKKKTRR